MGKSALKDAVNGWPRREYWRAVTLIGGSALTSFRSLPLPNISHYRSRAIGKVLMSS